MWQVGSIWPPVLPSDLYFNFLILCLSGPVTVTMSILVVHKVCVTFDPLYGRMLRIASLALG